MIRFSILSLTLACMLIVGCRSRTSSYYVPPATVAVQPACPQQAVVAGVAPVPCPNQPVPVPTPYR